MIVFRVMALATRLTSTWYVFGSTGTRTNLILKYPAAFMKAACIVSGTTLHIWINMRYKTDLREGMISLHFRILDSLEILVHVTIRLACHDDAFGATAGHSTTSSRWSIVHAEYHGDAFRFHSSDAREDFWMQGVRDSKPAIRFGQQIGQLLASVINCSRDFAVLPVEGSHILKTLSLSVDRHR